MEIKNFLVFFGKFHAVGAVEDHLDVGEGICLCVFVFLVAYKRKQLRCGRWVVYNIRRFYE